MTAAALAALVVMLAAWWRYRHRQTVYLRMSDGWPCRLVGRSG